MIANHIIMSYKYKMPPMMKKYELLMKIVLDLAALHCTFSLTIDSATLHCIVYSPIIKITYSVERRSYGGIQLMSMQ